MLNSHVRHYQRVYGSKLSGVRGSIQAPVIDLWRFFDVRCVRKKTRRIQANSRTLVTPEALRESKGRPKLELHTERAGHEKLSLKMLGKHKGIAWVPSSKPKRCWIQGLLSLWTQNPYPKWSHDQGYSLHALWRSMISIDNYWYLVFPQRQESLAYRGGHSPSLSPNHLKLNAAVSCDLPMVLE